MINKDGFIKDLLFIKKDIINNMPNWCDKKETVLMKIDHMLIDLGFSADEVLKQYDQMIDGGEK